MAEEPFDYEKSVYDKLTGKLKHYCPDWDFMAIDENSPEFSACTCEWPKPPRPDDVADD